MACCEVCTLHYTVSYREKITCACCFFEVCKSCMKKFLLSRKSPQPICMNCNSPYSIIELRKRLGVLFVGGKYQSYRAQIIAEREIATLPEVASRVEQKQTIHKLHEEREAVTDKLKIAQKQFEAIKKEAEGIDNTIKDWAARPSRPPPKKKIYCMTRQCRGVLNDEFQCAVCSTRFCEECREVLEPNHKCNEEIVSSINELKKNSQGCPGCGIRISKVSGCGQMWCTNCHSFFEWGKTTVMKVGVGHNPHFMRYMRENANREDRAWGQCDEPLVDYDRLYDSIINYIGNDNQLMTEVSAMYKSAETVSGQINGPLTNIIEELRDTDKFKVSYAMGGLSASELGRGVLGNQDLLETCEALNAVLFTYFETVRQSVIGIYNTPVITGDPNELTDLVRGEVEQARQMAILTSIEVGKLSEANRNLPSVYIDTDFVVWDKGERE